MPAAATRKLAMAAFLMIAVGGNAAAAGAVEETAGSSVVASAFGTVVVPFQKLPALRMIAPSLAEMATNTTFLCEGGACSEAQTAVKAALERTSISSIRDKLMAVNVTINHAIRYSEDTDIYKVTDHWATPSETLARQQGDCEDFAILKMAALRSIGVEAKDMALIVLRDDRRNVFHAVLSVSVGGNRVILDNLRDALLTDRDITGYKPLYSIAEGKGYLNGYRVGDKATIATPRKDLDRIGMTGS